MDADRGRDVGQAHVAHAVPAGQVAGGVQDGVLALLLLLGAAGPLAAGHRLVAATRRPDALADLADRYGGRILPVALDVTDPGCGRGRGDRGAGAFGRINVVDEQRRLRQPRVGPLGTVAI